MVKKCPIVPDECELETYKINVYLYEIYYMSHVYKYYLKNTLVTPN
jgi:hypothetical protein